MSASVSLKNTPNYLEYYINNKTVRYNIQRSRLMLHTQPLVYIQPQEYLVDYLDYKRSISMRSKRPRQLQTIHRNLENPPSYLHLLQYLSYKRYPITDYFHKNKSTPSSPPSSHR
jgi:hypothetical protein